MKKISRRKAIRLSAGALAGAAAGRQAVAQTLRPEWEGDLQGVDSIIVPQPVDPLTKTVCPVTPEAIDGPYYFHGAHMRSEIAEDREGVPLRLGIQVLDATWSPDNMCFPIPEAIVDIWHADALGIYSNVPASTQGVDTTGETWLRGAQTSDGNGYVEFQTIMPGWYLEEGGPPWKAIFGRAVHIHAKVYFRNKVLTTQIYFPNDFLQQLYAEHAPYKDTPTRTSRTTGDIHNLQPNEEDWVFLQGGPVVEIERDGEGFYAKASVGIFNA